MAAQPDLSDRLSPSDREFILRALAAHVTTSMLPHLGTEPMSVAEWTEMAEETLTQLRRFTGEGR